VAGGADNRPLSVNSGCIVRAARERDLGAALALVAAKRPENRALDRIPEILEDALGRASSEYRVCVAERDGEFAGVGVYGWIAGTVGAAALYTVVVARDEEDVGTGRAILEKILSELRSSGTRLIVAEFPGHTSLGPYRALIEGAGFVEESVVVDYYEDRVPLIQYRIDLN
jgi:L-amino acid N-acyltransferase YncA